ncbi:hypothetical protein J1614_010832 [Plenodomus biglobosus]|nr:hypothetical protein J1614_010832 [Plenodomus biglobosus]
MTSGTTAHPEHSEVAALQETIRAMQELLRTTQARLSLLEDTQSSVNTASDLSPISNSHNTSRRSSVASIDLPSSPTVMRSSSPTLVDADTTPVAESTPVMVVHSTTAVAEDPVALVTVSSIPEDTVALVTVSSTPEDTVVSVTVSSAPEETVASVTMSSTPDETLSPTTQSALPQFCTRTHVHRRPLDEECPICYDSAQLSTCEPTELVWCRSGCGRSIHKSCFGAWRTQCEKDGRDLTCSICRTDWASDCGCTGCTAVHARRRVVAGACPICQEDIGTSEDQISRDVKASPLTWCDSGCGESVHASCFTFWQAECVENGRGATCVTCRAVWRDGQLSSCSGSGRF